MYGIESPLEREQPLISPLTRGTEGVGKIITEKHNP